MFSRTLSAGNRLNCWKTNPIDSRRSFGSSFGLVGSTSLPSMNNRPVSCVNMQPRMQRSVVLPEPEGPSSATISPLRTLSEIPRTAWTTSCPVRKVFTRSIASIAAVPRVIADAGGNLHILAPGPATATKKEGRGCPGFTSVAEDQRRIERGDPSKRQDGREQAQD